MTIFDVAPAEVVAIAEEFAIPRVSFWTTELMRGARPVTAENVGEVRARLRDSPVVVDTVETFLLGPAPAKLEASIALAAELGATAIVAVNLAAEEDRAAGLLAGLCEMAQRYDLLVSLEPIYVGATRTPSEGLRILEKSGASNARLTLDLLHVHRSGTLLAELARIDPGVISSAQICDGPASADGVDPTEEGAYSRMIPGTGDFGALGFLRAIPPTVSLGMEVPMRALREGGTSARERTRRVFEATRALQEQAAR